MNFTPRRLAFIAAVALLVVFIIVIIYLQRSVPVTYVTAEARQGDIENAVLAVGKLDAIERVNVGAQVSGQVKSLKVKLGDLVRKDQLLETDTPFFNFK